MSEHVVGRVTGTRVCLSCSDLSASGAWECCPPNDQCPCCLSAELTALRAAVERVRELPAIQIAYPDGHVRDMVELATILTALDGGDDGQDDQRTLPLHRTEAGWPNCSTCDGGGCYDCTESAYRL